MDDSSDSFTSLFRSPSHSPESTLVAKGWSRFLPFLVFKEVPRLAKVNRLLTKRGNPASPVNQSLRWNDD